MECGAGCAAEWRARGAARAGWGTRRGPRRGLSGRCSRDSQAVLAARRWRSRRPGSGNLRVSRAARAAAETTVSRRGTPQSLRPARLSHSHSGNKASCLCFAQEAAPVRSHGFWSRSHTRTHSLAHIFWPREGPSAPYVLCVLASLYRIPPVNMCLSRGHAAVPTRNALLLFRVALGRGSLGKGSLTAYCDCSSRGTSPLLVGLSH
nr:uncharacterized protein LOC119625218 [Chlorocebus sabaeus]XP_037856976.1 uncharacterized protein LOC119625218 [Chlorocebus sabaeus]